MIKNTTVCALCN